jgi:rubrerythrin
MADRKDINRYLANLNDERSSAALYRVMAEHEKNSKIAEVYRRLAETEDAHADAWVKRLVDAAAEVPAFRPSLRTRTLIWLVPTFRR